MLGVKWSQVQILSARPKTALISGFSSDLVSGSSPGLPDHPEHAATITQVLAIPPKRTIRTIIEFLAPVEVDALLAAPDCTTWTGRRDHALLAMTAQSGRRISEICSLTHDDVHLGTGPHVACTGKGRRQRVTPLTRATVSTMTTYLAERNTRPGSALFCGSHGQHLSRDALEHRLAKHVATAGQFLCHKRDCTRYQQGGPVRDIVSWIRRRDNFYISEPLVIDGKTIRGEKQQAVWDVLLICDHFGHQTAEPDWDPKEGPRHQKGKNRRRGLDDMLEVVAQGDPDKENYWRRMYAEDHPEPAPFVYCYTCARVRSILAYERVGWLEPKPKPAKPRPSPRKSLERRLKKLEAEAAELRERLKSLPDQH